MMQYLHHKAHDYGTRAWESTLIVALFRRCGHILWSEVGNIGGAGVVVFLDDDQRSGTYAEHVTRCPSCAARLDDGAFRPRAAASRQS